MTSLNTDDVKVQEDSKDCRSVSEDKEKKHHKHKKEKKKDKKKEKKKHKHKHKDREKDREKSKGDGRKNKGSSPREGSMDSDDLLEVLEKKKVQLLDMKDDLKEKTLSSKLKVEKDLLGICAKDTTDSVHSDGKLENNVEMEVDINDLPLKVDSDIPLPESLEDIPIPASPGNSKSDSNESKTSEKNVKKKIEGNSVATDTAVIEIEKVPLPPPQQLDSIPIPNQLNPPKPKATAEKSGVNKPVPEVKPSPKPIPPPGKPSINILTPNNFQASIRESMLREVGKAETGLPQNIVDDFFKDFLASKMKQIESEYMYKLMTKQLSMEDEKKSSDGVASSVEEMNKLLDEELSTIATATQQNDKKKSKWDSKEKPSSSVSNQTESGEGKPSDEAQNKPRVEVQIGTKRGGKLQMEFKITKTSADMISSGEMVRAKDLEDGEVSSSSDDDSDSEDSKENGEVSETGSLSSSDKDSKPQKKRRKKKEKKKKKKKHKSKDPESDSRSKRKHSHRSRSRSPKKRRSSRSRSRSRERPSNSKYIYDAYQYRDKVSDRYERDRDRHHNDRDRSRDRRRFSERDSQDDRDRHRRRSKSKSRSPTRSKSKDRPFRVSADLRVKIDKAKLREIAIKNCIAMAKSGQVASSDLAAIKSGGKSIDELTDFCKRISSKSKNRADSPSSSEDEMVQEKSEEDEFIHHPFKVRDNSSIILNIRDAKPLPIRTPAEKLQESATLRLQFPVSSGSTHRMKESEWVPVEKTTATATATTTAPVTTATSNTTTADSVLMPPPPIPSPALLPTNAAPTPVRPEDRVFPEVPQGSIDIGAIISERLTAFKKLQENPNDIDAVMTLGKVQEKASMWAQSKNLPGKFLGSTGAHIMSQEELIGPDKKRQAWAKRVGVQFVKKPTSCN